MFSVSKELGVFKRKRKRLIRDFDLSDKEKEKKEPSSKRQKKMMKKIKGLQNG